MLVLNLMRPDLSSAAGYHKFALVLFRAYCFSAFNEREKQLAFKPGGIHGKQCQPRRFMQGAGLAAAGAGALIATSSTALAATTPAVGSASLPQFKSKPLPFDPKSIEGLSEKILVSHHDNNYAGAVKRLNAIKAQLDGIDFATAPGFVLNGLKREELMAMNSMILHEVYFAGFVGDAKPSKQLADAIARDFGSMDRWQAEFTALGKAEGGGSGWVLLSYSPHDKRLVNQWAADHTTNIAGGRPILALDMYEHAYHMDYGAKAGDYVAAFMKAMRWENASKLFKTYSRET
jgi:superoxide dismutase, Fe-Mn family